jgi:hypothetical protein
MFKRTASDSNPSSAKKLTTPVAPYACPTPLVIANPVLSLKALVRVENPSYTTSDPSPKTIVPILNNIQGM